MLSDKMVVGDNMVVSINYVLKLKNGQEMSRADGDDPLEFIQGFGQIIPGLEQEVYGMAVGDSKEVSIKPTDAYGELNSDEIVEVARDNFPDNINLVVGEPISVRDRETGENFVAYISEVNDESVLLDFNHPLAGEELYFSVEIVGLRQASDEELAHGHVHQDGKHH